MPKFSTPLASAVIFLTTCPAFAGPTINVDWIDNFTIPFTFNFSQMSSGGLNQPLNLTASTTASGLIPGFSSLDPRLGASVGIPISRSISTTFNAQVSSLTAVFGPNCTVFFPCPSDSLTQTAGISIKNLSQGISLTGSSVQSANIPSLPPSVARSLNYFISAPSPDVVTSTSSVNTGTYSFDVNLDITAPRIINREFPSVSGTVTGSIVGTTDTKVEIVGSTGGGPADKLESILIELKKSYNELARSSKEFTLAGLAASSIAYYGPAIYPPVIALTPELLDLQAEFLTTGQLLKQSFPTSIPGDPPLPSILPSGIVTGQLASQFDLFNMNSEKIVGLIQSTKNSINDTVDALSKSDLTNAAALESKISQSLSDIRT